MHLTVLLGALVVVLGRSGTLLERSWGALGRSWGALGIPNVLSKRYLLKSNDAHGTPLKPTKNNDFRCSWPLLGRSLAGLGALSARPRLPSAALDLWFDSLLLCG